MKESDKDTAVIFPAFAPEYSVADQKLISLLDPGIRDLLTRASEITGCELSGFDPAGNNFLDSEEKNQYAGYVISCSIAGVLKQKKLIPKLTSGYSMGIYAALHYAGSLSFEDGIRLIMKAWDIISQVSESREFGMGMVIGLEKNDILAIISDNAEVEICNTNNRHTYIISGLKNAVINSLESFKEEGALKISLLPVSKPYHSAYLKDCPKLFEQSITGIRFSDPEFPYLSSLDQRILISSSDIREEVIKNLASRMNWQNTIEKIISLGVNQILECGSGDSLSRNSRFIEGSFRAIPANSISEFPGFASEDVR